MPSLQESLDSVLRARIDRAKAEEQQLSSQHRFLEKKVNGNTLPCLPPSFLVSPLRRPCLLDSHSCCVRGWCLPLYQAKMVSSEAEKFDCPVCLATNQSTISAVLPPCGHICCTVCMKGIFHVYGPGARCPMCKAPIRRHELFQVWPSSLTRFNCGLAARRTRKAPALRFS